MDELKPGEIELGDKQYQAVELAVRGFSDKEIARRIGVTRQLVNTWRNHDTEFRYLLMLKRQAVMEKNQDQLNSLVERALEVVGRALESGDEKTQLQAAMSVLRLAGMAGRGGKMPSRAEVEKEMIINAVGQVAQEMGLVV